MLKTVGCEWFVFARTRLTPTLPRSINMAFPKSKQKRLVVDDLPYIACVSENGRVADGGVKLRVIVQADYGHESLCVISGMVIRDYWFDFPDIDREKTFAITPRVILSLIHI